MTTHRYRLHPAIDVAALRRSFAARGRVRISEFLVVDDAIRLREHLSARTDWRQVLNSGDKLFELDRPTRDAMTSAQRAALDTAVLAGARDGFQYRYESIRVPDGAAARVGTDDALTALATWLSGGEAMALFRAVTGAADIDYADAQATAYAPGDFLTAHDDAVAGKGRRAAYVLGLSAGWRIEWGGALLFHRAEGEIEGVAPAFNTLDLLAVPQLHSVSMVTGSAPYRRYSVTGWLRAQPQPE